MLPLPIIVSIVGVCALAHALLAAQRSQRSFDKLLAVNSSHQLVADSVTILWTQLVVNRQHSKALRQQMARLTRMTKGQHAETNINRAKMHFIL